MHRRDCESKILERGKTRGNHEASWLGGGGRAGHLRYESDSGQCESRKVLKVGLYFVGPWKVGEQGRVVHSFCFIECLLCARCCPRC